LRTISWLLVPLLGLPVFAQRDQLQDPPAPRFRSAARLIQVSVVVRDRRNRPLPDLGRADFRVFEDGQEVPIAFFQPTQRSGSEGSGPTTTPRGRTEFTNRIESPGAGGVVAIVFDQLNTSAIQQSRARTHLLTYLKTLRAGDRVALYVLAADGLHVLYDFTTDASLLLRALQAIEPGAASKMGPSELQLPPALTEGLSAFAMGNLAGMNAALNQLRTETTLEALEAVAAHLAGIPGRKNIVWISSGFPFIIGGRIPPGQVARTRRATRALSTADAAVYPVDIRGLLAGRGAAVPTLNGVYGPIEGLRVTADWTGGRAFFNDNDIAGAIAQAVDDSRDSYVLGYYPVNEDWNGRFREIKVKVTRDGATVRHRAGYIADPPIVSAANDQQRVMLEAIASPLELTGLPVDVVAERAVEGVLLRIRLDATRLTLTELDGQVTGELVVAITQMLEDRRQIAEMNASFPLKVASADRERLLATPIELTRTVRLHPDAVQVRVVIRDARAVAVGSVFLDADRLRTLSSR
jgi:VWFA-related protein